MLSEWLLLDQDEATVQELTAEDASQNASGWLHQTCNRLLHTDMFAHIRSSETLLRIRSTAEQFDPAAEAIVGPFQVTLPASCLGLPFVSLGTPLAPAVCFSLSLSACPMHLPFVSFSFYLLALCLCLLVLCTCPVFLSACPLHLPFVSLCLPFTLALCLSLSACPLHLPCVSLPLPFEHACVSCHYLSRPQWCMILL